MKYKHRPASLGDALVIASGLRASDKAELQAGGFADMARALVACYRASTISCSVALVGEKPVAIYGLAPGKEKGDAVPWMLATDGVYADRRALVDDAKEVLAQWQADHEKLYNLVYSKSRTSIRWLKRLGFDVTASTVKDPQTGEEFNVFHWRK